MKTTTPENGTIINFPLDNKDFKNTNNSFEKIQYNCLFEAFQNFSVLKNHSGLSLIPVEKNLTVVINRSSISPEQEIKICGKLFIELEINEIPYYQSKMDMILSKIVLEELNLDIDYNLIKKGNHLVSIFEDKIKIQVALTK